MTLDSHPSCTAHVWACTELLACAAQQPLKALPATKASTARVQAVLAGFAARAASLAHAPGAPKPRAPALPAGSGSADSTLTAVGARRAADGHVIVGLGSLGSSRPGSGKGRAGRLGPSAAARAAGGGGDRGAGGGAQIPLGSSAGAPQGAAPMLRVTAAVAARLSASYRQDCGSLASTPAPGPQQEARRGLGREQPGGVGRSTLPARANTSAAGADEALREGAPALAGAAAPVLGHDPMYGPSLAHPHASVRAAAQYLAVVAAGRAFGAPPAPAGPGAVPLGMGEAEPMGPGLPAQGSCPGIGSIAAAGGGGEQWGPSRSEDTSSQHPLFANRLSASREDALAAAGGLSGKPAAAAALAKKAAVEAQEAHVQQKGLENLMAWMRESAGAQGAGGGGPPTAPVQGTPPQALLL